MKHSLAAIAGLCLAVTPLSSRADDTCDALQRVVALNGDFGSIAGIPAPAGSVDSQPSTIQLDGAGECSVPDWQGLENHLFTCIWGDLATDVPEAQRIAEINRRRDAQVSRLKGLVATCFPEAAVYEPYSNAVSTAYRLPSAYLVVGGYGPAANLSVMSRSFSDQYDAQHPRRP